MGKAKVKAPDYGSVTAFPTKIITRDWDVPELNRELKLAIWRARALDPVGLYRSNTAGTWHSKVDILATTGDVGLELHRMLRLSPRTQHTHTSVTLPSTKSTYAYKHGLWSTRTVAMLPYITTQTATPVLSITLTTRFHLKR